MNEVTYHVPMLCEVLDRLSHEIRESRKVNAELLEWFKGQPGADFTEKQLHRLAELKASIESLFGQSESDRLVLVCLGDKTEALARRMSSLATYARAIDKSTP